MDFEQDIKAAIAVLETGGTILYPTDTVWGLGCNALDSNAVAKVAALKQRNPEKSFIVLLADARDVLQYIAAPPPDIIAMLEEMNTPTTVIYDGALGFADNVIHENGSVAIRITTDPFCKALIKRYRKPVLSTSANISGQPTPAIFSQVAPGIVAGVDYVVQHRQSDITPSVPSRLVKIDSEGTITILRY